ncbi:hypothetical protein HK096_000534, partial [Nowakowskiella sp. JEL0078]
RGPQGIRPPARLQSSLVATPKPVDLPSLRRENAGSEVSVAIVPTGSVGWATMNENMQSKLTSASQSIPAPTTSNNTESIVKTNVWGMKPILVSTESEIDKVYNSIFFTWLLFILI